MSFDLLSLLWENVISGDRLIGSGHSRSVVAATVGFGVASVRRYSSAELRLLSSTNERRHVVADDVAARIRLLGVRRSCRRRGGRGGR